MKHTARRAVIASLVSVVLAALLYWFWLPPIHPRCPDFWTFILACLVIVLVVFSLAGLTGAKRKGAGKKEDTVVDFGGTKVHLPSMPNLHDKMGQGPSLVRRRDRGADDPRLRDRRHPLQRRPV